MRRWQANGAWRQGRSCVTSRAWGQPEVLGDDAAEGAEDLPAVLGAKGLPELARLARAR